MSFHFSSFFLAQPLALKVFFMVASSVKKAVVSSSPCLEATSPASPFAVSLCVQGSKLLILEMVTPPLVGNPYSGYFFHPYCWVDEFIPNYMENHGSLDPSTCELDNPKVQNLGQFWDPKDLTAAICTNGRCEWTRRSCSVPWFLMVSPSKILPFEPFF